MRSHLFDEWKNGTGLISGAKHVPTAAMPAEIAAPSLSCLKVVDGRLTIPIDVRQRWLQDPIRNFEWKKFSQSSMRITVTAAQLLQPRQLPPKNLQEQVLQRLTRLPIKRPEWADEPGHTTCKPDAHFAPNPEARCHEYKARSNECYTVVGDSLWIRSHGKSPRKNPLFGRICPFFQLFFGKSK